MAHVTWFGRSDSEDRTDTDAADAAAWLARHRLGTLDEAAFAAWRDGDVAHAVAFARAMSMWEKVGRDSPASMRADRPPARSAVPVVSRRTFVRSAAAMLAIGVIGAGTVATRAYAWNSATTALGENKHVRLPDGSLAALNTDSRLSWRFSGEERTFWIERGEIALDLRRGTDAVMHAKDCAVILSAGRFNIRLRDEALDLLVQDGRVRLLGQPAPLVEARNGIASLLVSPDGTVVRPTDTDQVERITAWQRREILFRDATLGSAVEEYNRFLPRKIVIVDRELASIPVGGRFVTSDPGAFLDAISTGLNVRVSRSPNAYLLTR